MLVSCAIGLRRPTEAAIPFATLAAWCVLLLALCAQAILSLR